MLTAGLAAATLYGLHGSVGLVFQMGYTALLRASSQGLLDVVRVCLEAGCAVDFADEVSRLLCTTPTLRPLSVQSSSVPVQRPKPKTSSPSPTYPPTLTRKRMLTYFHARTPPTPTSTHTLGYTSKSLNYAAFHKRMLKEYFLSLVLAGLKYMDW